GVAGAAGGGEVDALAGVDGELPVDGIFAAVGGAAELGAPGEEEDALAGDERRLLRRGGDEVEGEAVAALAVAAAAVEGDDVLECEGGGARGEGGTEGADDDGAGGCARVDGRRAAGGERHESGGESEELHGFPPRAK